MQTLTQMNTVLFSKTNYISLIICLNQLIIIIITIYKGIFIICWLPFFYMYVYCAVTKTPFHPIVDRMIVWIGYVNSFINPIVYALTSK